MMLYCYTENQHDCYTENQHAFFRRGPAAAGTQDFPAGCGAPRATSSMIPSCAETATM